jgi:hypothetical protein
MNNAKTLVEAVKAHAVKNYEQGGWDYVVECWSSADIETKIVENVLDTEPKAIAWFGEIVGLLDERRRDVQAEIF